LLQLAQAASAAVRVALGKLWLRAYVRLHWGTDPDARMKSIWAAARRLRILFAGAEVYHNRFGRDWRDWLLLWILREMHRVRLQVTPRVRIRGIELLLSNADRRIRTIVVTTHSPVDAVLNRVFQENGFASTLLAKKNDRIVRKARLLGLQGELDTIARTSDALLIMRRKLNEGRLIVACVDFTLPRTGSFRVDLLVSPAMFELAKSVRASLLYADTWVSADGAIDVAFGQPGIDMAASSADMLAGDFISWLHGELGDRRKLRVMKWQRKENRRTGLLKLPETTARPDR